MNENQKAFLDVLSAALRGESCETAEREAVLTLAGKNSVLPLIADALQLSAASKNAEAVLARRLAILQAQRTGDFLLLLRELERRGLRPAVLKGLVCRSLYPKPSLRYSADEDLMIRPEELEAYHQALLAADYVPEKGRAPEQSDYEASYRNPDNTLMIELHLSLFPADSEAYGACARYFDGALERAVEMRVEGVSILTLAPTDHLLFLICHAYKHFLHSGAGIRQLCDQALMAERYERVIDWDYIRAACDELRITKLCAAMFRICDRHLGVRMPPAFAGVEADESALLEDVLSGGRFINSNMDRARSSTLTLEAVSAARAGRRRRGALHAVFLPVREMRGHYPYLDRFPWLLPIAWLQRIWRYLRRKKHPEPIRPARSLQIARERIQLLRDYEIID